MDRTRIMREPSAQSRRHAGVRRGLVGGLVKTRGTRGGQRSCWAMMNLECISLIEDELSMSECKWTSGTAR